MDRQNFKDPFTKAKVLRNKEYRKVFPKLQDFVENSETISKLSPEVEDLSASTREMITAALNRRRNELLNAGIGLEFQGFPDYVNFFPTPEVQVVGVNGVLPGPIVDVATDRVPVSEAFYFRPVGIYHSYTSDSYEYTDALRKKDQETCYRAAKAYYQQLQAQCPPEAAELVLPRNLRAVFWLLGPYRAILECLYDQTTKHSDTDYENRLLGYLGLQALKLQDPKFFAWASEHLEFETERALNPSQGARDWRLPD
jgi:hypothetical protein